jgi:hypothetical protein
LDCTLNEIREASGVQSDNTIRKYFNSLIDKKDRILKEVMKDELPADLRDH